ncbi:MAG: NrpR regulatory domain-containing protein, partial [Methanoregula sp.]|nr:NrpR regulatory domain-containing protein [Methanoregula sp.]
MTAPLKFVNHSIDDFAMKVTYRPKDNEGSLVYNLSFVRNEDLEFAIGTLKDAAMTRIMASGLVRFLSSGEKLDSFVVPKGQTGICTVCSITFDGLLIRHGVPINLIGGGLVEIENRTPVRFTNMVLYEYTTIDPLQ